MIMNILILVIGVLLGIALAIITVIGISLKANINE